MTDTTDTPGPDDARALAGELALRVLPPEEERAARAREAADPVFAAEVEAWNTHLAAFAEEVRPVQPSPGVWPRIESGISALVGGPVPANDNRVGFWRTWAIASTGLLAASVAGIAVLATRPEPAPVVQAVPEGGVTRVATLVLEDGAPAVTLAYDTVSGNLFIAPTAAIAGDDRVPHLWLVKADGSGVQLIGAIDDQESSRRTLDALLATEAGTATAVAVSLEAPGVTPGPNTPEGPVVASGELLQL